MAPARGTFDAWIEVRTFMSGTSPNRRFTPRLAFSLAALAALVGGSFSAPRPVAVADSSAWQAGTDPGFWDQNNPFPLKAVSCPGERVCYATGYASSPGRVLKTTDVQYGQWEPQTLSGTNATNLYLEAISCPSLDVCFAAGNAAGSAIFRTTNGGASWERHDRWDAGRGGPEPPSGWSGISCADTQHCIAVGPHGAIGATVDGGDTWYTQHSGLNQADPLAALLGISCATPTNCHAVGKGQDTGIAIGTADGGATWQVEPIGSPTSTLSGVSCTSDGTSTDCFAAGDVGGVTGSIEEYSDTPGNHGAGGGWVPAPSTGTSPLKAISCPKPHACVALGDGGSIVSSERPQSGGSQPPFAASAAVSAKGLVGVSCVGSIGTCVAVGTDTIITNVSQLPGPPPAPVIGTATAGDGQATVTFNPPTSGGPISSYRAEASPGGATATGPSSPITVGGLIDGTTYTIRVRATNAVGTGLPSQASNAVTPIADGAPQRPIMGSASAGDSQATVSFSPPASDGGHQITSYSVTSVPDGKASQGTSSPLTVTKLTDGTPYVFTVKATNSAGSSPPSATSNEVTPAAPGAPTVSPASGSAFGGTRVVVTGTGFSNAKSLSFGGVPAASFHVDSDTKVSAVTPAQSQPGSVPVTVTVDPPVPAGGHFTYFPGSLNRAEPMSMGRSGHTATLLTDGRVLVAGGCDVRCDALRLKYAEPTPYLAGEGPTASAELYDPVAGTWSRTEGMAVGRYGHTATLLTGGKVLVTGGCTAGRADPLETTPCSAPTAAAELYDPVTGKWSKVGSLKNPTAGGHTATLLPDGKVLIAGEGSCDHPNDTAELYDPSAKPERAWTSVGSASPCVSLNGYTATLLKTGDVLFAGPSTRVFSPSSPLASAWHDGLPSMHRPRRDHTATLLDDGRVLVAGGRNDTLDGDAAPDGELYDPRASGPDRVWTPTGPMRNPRVLHGAAALRGGAALPGGGVLVAGGHGTDLADGYEQPKPRDTFDAAEIYDVTADVWRLSGRIAPARFGPRLVSLPSGQALAIGGGLPFTTTQSYSFYPRVRGAVQYQALHHPGADAVDLYDGSDRAPRPHVSRLDAGAGPTTGAVGITITGSGLWSKATSVSVDGAPAQFSYLSEDRAQINEPAHPQGQAMVAVSVPDGGTSPPSRAAGFTYAPGSMTVTATGANKASLKNCEGGAAAPPDVPPLPAPAGIGQAGSGTTNSCSTRWAHTATRLDGPACRSGKALYCGQVLVTGGYTTFFTYPAGSGDPWSVAASAELYDPGAGKWTYAGSMLAPRVHHTATLLDGPECQAPSPAAPLWCGKVLVAGGEDPRGNAVNTAELFDPATGLWSPTGAMAVPRFAHSATLMSGPGCVTLCGAVLAAGGTLEENGRGSGHATAEAYVPATGTWVPAGTLNTGRNSHTATLITGPTCGANCGKVLITGGLCCVTNPVDSDPAGRGSNLPGNSATQTIGTAELFDPTTLTWTPWSSRDPQGHTDDNALAFPRFLHSATALDGPLCGSVAPPAWCGRVLIAGGFDGRGQPLAHAVTYDPTPTAQQPLGTFSQVGQLQEARGGHTATLLRDGRVLVTGSGGRLEDQDPEPPQPTRTTEIYDPVRGSWSKTSELSGPRGAHTATLMADGTVLIAGGLSSAHLVDDDPTPCTCTDVTELYTPAPTVLSLTPNSGSNAGGTKVVVTGARFDSAGAVHVGDSVLPSSAYHIDSPTQITLTTPASQGKPDREVSVSGPGGTSASIPPRPEATYTYNGCDQPLGAGQIAYPANQYSLIGVPDNTIVPADSLLYSWFDRNSGAYDSAIPTGAVTRGGHAYWAWFSCARPVTLGAGNSTAGFPLDAYHASMVGNPSGTSAAEVSGQDFAAAWNPNLNGGSGGYDISGYGQPSSLAVGYGTWVFSYRVTTVTIDATRGGS